MNNKKAKPYPPRSGAGFRKKKDKKEEAQSNDANREMFGDDEDYFDAAGIDDIGNK